MSTKNDSKTCSAERVENRDFYKLKTMTDGMVQMRTLAKYTNYNDIDWDEPKNQTEELFGVVRFNCC